MASTMAGVSLSAPKIIAKSEPLKSMTMKIKTTKPWTRISVSSAAVGRRSVAAVVVMAAPDKLSEKGLAAGPIPAAIYLQTSHSDAYRSECCRHAGAVPTGRHAGGRIKKKNPQSSFHPKKKMALSLRPNQLLSPLKIPLPKPKPNLQSQTTIIRCGPRNNRGPLVKGRILSVEAIQAVQAIKRAHHSDPETAPTVISRTLSRLIKSDLLAVLKELLRQDRCALALQVFSVVRSEYRPELSLYADVVKSLARSGLAEDIDRLIVGLESDGGVGWGDLGAVSLVRAVIAADMRESTVMIYGMLKSSVVGSTGFKGDDYIVGSLSKGLKRLGEPGLADEVVRLFGRFYDNNNKGNLDKLIV